MQPNLTLFHFCISTLKFEGSNFPPITSAFLFNCKALGKISILLCSISHEPHIFNAYLTFFTPSLTCSLLTHLLHQDTAPGESSVAFLFPTTHWTWLKFWATSLWLTNSNCYTGHHTTSTCGWVPSLSQLCPEAESDRSCHACLRDSSERWETVTGGPQLKLNY